MTTQPNRDDERKADRAAGSKQSANDPPRKTPTSGAAEAESDATDPGALDAIDEAEYESFPASDPPSYTGSACSPSVPKKEKE